MPRGVGAWIRVPPIGGVYLDPSPPCTWTRAAGPEPVPGCEPGPLSPVNLDLGLSRCLGVTWSQVLRTWSQVLYIWTLRTWSQVLRTWSQVLYIWTLRTWSQVLRTWSQAREPGPKKMRTWSQGTANLVPRNCEPGPKGVEMEIEECQGVVAHQGPDNLPVSLRELTTRSPLLKAEVNLLRLPVFALSTRGLRTLNGLDSRGSSGGTGEQHEYAFRTARSVDTLYPGPLARAAHLALLSLGTERLPVPHPLVWTWRELCRRIGCSPSGTMIGKLKEALTATASLTIRSRSAIYSKPLKRYLTESEGVFHLYDRLVFHGGVLPDGTKADLNHLWLAEWYRGNLDSLYAAPLDHELWRWLDARSPIASRAYEFLLRELLRVPRRADQLLDLGRLPPRAAERYYSQAQRQLDPALGPGRSGAGRDGDLDQGQATGSPSCSSNGGSGSTGPRRPTPAPTPAVAKSRGAVEAGSCEPKDEFTARLTARSGRSMPDEARAGQARELIERHGQTKARSLVQFAVKKMRKCGPPPRRSEDVVRYPMRRPWSTTASRSGSKPSGRRGQTPARVMGSSSATECVPEAAGSRCDDLPRGVRERRADRRRSALHVEGPRLRSFFLDDLVALRFSSPAFGTASAPAGNRVPVGPQPPGSANRSFSRGSVVRPDPRCGSRDCPISSPKFSSPGDAFLPRGSVAPSPRDQLRERRGFPSYAALRGSSGSTGAPAVRPAAAPPDAAGRLR